MTQVGSEWPKWGRNGPIVLDAYLMYLSKARDVKSGYRIFENKAVYKNASTPESQLRKKHHTIPYHIIRYAVVSGAYRRAKEDTETNLSNLFTKVLSRPRR